VTFVGTYHRTVQAGGVLRGGRHVLSATADGATADWVDGGVRQTIGEGFKASYGYYGAHRSAQGALARLASVAVIGDSEGLAGPIRR
jgi:hypothetical protein